MSRRLSVLVLCGGQSAEHEISLQSAKTVLANLAPSRYESVPVLIERSGRWLLQKDASFLPNEDVPRPARPSGSPVHLERRGRAVVLASRSGARRVDVAFPVLHGPYGEDGTIQGLLELAGLPYVGCGVLASSVGMDKDAAKRLARAAGLPVPDDVVVRKGAPLSARASWSRDALRLGLPVFVKPASLGSSVGVSKVKRPSELLPAVREAFRYDVKVLIEKGIEGPELSCGVLGEGASVRASACGQIIQRGHEFYSYQAKYVDSRGPDLAIPAPIPARVSERVRELSRRVFQAVEGSGLARVDFFLEKRTGRIYFGELNTLPGFTSHSLYPRLWAATGLALPRLLDRLVGLALARGRARSRLLSSPR